MKRWYKCRPSKWTGEGRGRRALSKRDCCHKQNQTLFILLILLQVWFSTLTHLSLKQDWFQFLSGFGKRVQQPGFIKELPLSVCLISATHCQVSWAHYSLLSPQLWSTILHHMFVGLNTKPKFNTFYTSTGFVPITLQGVPPPLLYPVLAARVKTLPGKSISHWNKSFIGNLHSQFLGVDITWSGRNEWEAGGLLSGKP